MSGTPETSADAEQPLQTPWTFWFDRVSNEPYATALQRLGTVHTVQGFWRCAESATTHSRMHAARAEEYFEPRAHSAIRWHMHESSSAAACHAAIASPLDATRLTLDHAGTIAT